MATSASEDYLGLIRLTVHELRTPASVVGGYLRMLQRDQELNERQRKMIEEADRSCARLVAIVAELSDLGKLDSGTAAMAQRPLDFFQLTREVAELVQEGKDREVQLIVRGETGAAPVMGDATRLRHAVDAVFRAILREKAGPATVVAEHRVETLDGRPSAVVVIGDAATVFDAYNAPPGLFDETRGGMGLALPVARRVIVGHGGELWSPASPESLARSTIVLRMPLTESPR